MRNIKTHKGQKRTYLKPKIKRIRLDNEISMAMMSDPLGNPQESIKPDHFGFNPFKI